MGKRSTGRKLAMQILYQADIRNTSVDTIIDHFWDVHQFESDTTQWANDLAISTWFHKDTIDPVIEKMAIGWEFDRLNPIDKAILRLALYELIHDKIKPSVIINEAVEICKKYSSDDSHRFVNGILGQYVKQCSPES
ncbi:transcription antitermination factor NusB [bacterium]|nr:transcription antitermination factor NusB [bacterium]